MGTMDRTRRSRGRGRSVAWRGRGHGGGKERVRPRMPVLPVCLRCSTLPSYSYSVGDCVRLVGACGCGRCRRAWDWLLRRGTCDSRSRRNGGRDRSNGHGSSSSGGGPRPALRRTTRHHTAPHEATRHWHCAGVRWPGRPAEATAAGRGDGRESGRWRDGGAVLAAALLLLPPSPRVGRTRANQGCVAGTQTAGSSYSRDRAGGIDGGLSRYGPPAPGRSAAPTADGATGLSRRGGVGKPTPSPPRATNVDAGTRRDEARAGFGLLMAVDTCVDVCRHACACAEERESCDETDRRGGGGGDGVPENQSGSRRGKKRKFKTTVAACPGHPSVRRSRMAESLADVDCNRDRLGCGSVAGSDEQIWAGVYDMWCVGGRGEGGGR